MIYMNSSAADVEGENLAGEVNLTPSRGFKGGEVDVNEYLGNPQNCVSFNDAVGISAGTELLAYYKMLEQDADIVMSELSN